MSYHLFLDDERKPKDVTWVELPLHQWMIARNYQQFVEMIERMGLPTTISFDHDLSEQSYEFVREAIATGKVPYDKIKEKTGFHCAKWLIEYCLDKNLELPYYYIHTMNPVGAENIRGLLVGFEKFKST